MFGSTQLPKPLVISKEIQIAFFKKHLASCVSLSIGDEQNVLACGDSSAVGSTEGLQLDSLVQTHHDSNPQP